jgi:hypothetical protein
MPAAGEAMVTKDSVSYFLGPDGKPSRKTTLSWSQPPNALVAGRQYVAALLPGGVEVKSISRAGAAAAEQVRACSDMRCLCFAEEQHKAPCNVLMRNVGNVGSQCCFHTVLLSP